MSIYPAPKNSDTFNETNFDTSNTTTNNNCVCTCGGTSTGTGTISSDSYVLKTGDTMSGTLIVSGIKYNDNSDQTTAFTMDMKNNIKNISSIANETTINNITSDRIILTDANGDQTLTSNEIIQIETNTGNILSNSLNITSNASNIADNTLNITSNASAIANNALNIADNITDIDLILSKQTSIITTTDQEKLTHLSTDNASLFHLYSGGSRDMNIHTGSGKLLLYTNDVYIGNATKGRLHINSGIQNYAYLDSDRDQIQTNKTNIQTNTSNIQTNTTNISNIMSGSTSSLSAVDAEKLSHINTYNSTSFFLYGGGDREIVIFPATDRPVNLYADLVHIGRPDTTRPSEIHINGGIQYRAYTEEDHDWYMNSIKELGSRVDWLINYIKAQNANVPSNVGYSVSWEKQWYSYP